MNGGRFYAQFTDINHPIAYTILSMTTSSIPSGYYPGTAGALATAPAAQTAPAATSAAEKTDFTQLLSTMMMLSSLAAGSGGSSGDPGGLSALSMPLMMMLMEQMLSQQVAETQPDSETATLNSPANGLPIPGRDTPQGHPVPGAVLTQRFHGSHNGLDFGTPVGTPIKATMNGKVVYAGWNDQGYGNLVILENGPYRTLYAHLSEVPVSVGQQVSAGSVIGLSGNTGNSTGPHLHYEIRLNGSNIDPTTVTLG
jgi:murein DD-endopeptidase MepM/ murein hydrolase activator NlpD